MLYILMRMIELYMLVYNIFLNALDVTPWYYYGNSPKDTTSIYDRHFLYKPSIGKMERRNERGK